MTGASGGPGRSHTVRGAGGGPDPREPWITRWSRPPHPVHRGDGRPRPGRPRGIFSLSPHNGRPWAAYQVRSGPAGWSRPSRSATATGCDGVPEHRVVEGGCSTPPGRGARAARVARAAPAPDRQGRRALRGPRAADPRVLHGPHPRQGRFVRELPEYYVKQMTVWLDDQRVSEFQMTSAVSPNPLVRIPSPGDAAGTAACPVREQRRAALGSVRGDPGLIRTYALEVTMTELTRRDFLRMSAAGRRTRRGGGHLAGCAAPTKEQSRPEVRSPNRTFVSCPFSNLVLSGVETMEAITIGYDGLRARRQDPPRGGHRHRARHEARPGRRGLSRVRPPRRVAGVDFLWDQVEGCAGQERRPARLEGRAADRRAGPAAPGHAGRRRVRHDGSAGRLSLPARPLRARLPDRLVSQDQEAEGQADRPRRQQRHRLEDGALQGRLPGLSEPRVPPANKVDEVDLGAAR